MRGLWNELPDPLLRVARQPPTLRRRYEKLDEGTLDDFLFFPVGFRGPECDVEIDPRETLPLAGKQKRQRAQKAAQFENAPRRQGMDDRREQDISEVFQRVPEFMF